MHIYFFNKKNSSEFKNSEFDFIFISFHNLMELGELMNLTYNNCSENNSSGDINGPNRWNRIIILDKNKNPIDDRVYLLDHKEKLITKIKRQRRRDLGKVTGKKKVPKNWKQIIEKLDDLELSSNSMNSPVLSPCEFQSSSSTSDQETQQFDSLSFDKLISIDWLLNQPTELSTVF